MATAIIGVILVLICVAAVRSYCKKLSHGCCGGGESTVLQNGPDDQDPSHYPYEYTVGIEGMSCQNCAARIENALNRLDGVWAKVSLKEKKADIRLKTPPEDIGDTIRQTITRLDYRVTDPAEPRS